MRINDNIQTLRLVTLFLALKSLHSNSQRKAERDKEKKFHISNAEQGLRVS